MFSPQHTSDTRLSPPLPKAWFELQEETLLSLFASPSLPFFFPPRSFSLSFLFAFFLSTMTSSNRHCEEALKPDSIVYVGAHDVVHTASPCGKILSSTLPSPALSLLTPTHILRHCSGCPAPPHSVSKSTAKDTAAD